ncbi:PAC2 family protein [Leucobacter denitrificans]|uniref:PAC2 family protein n=1 Tax=Leucobacter denitrificans TaxID=683042 RepID=A0A7G9S5X9_9MICO|nr:PAC2 family protein [Leucobacter denitrificans]QNN63254.1 PAC2 family protein [Leucobacter denitrificans]
MNDSADPTATPRALIVAFQGWSDAGDATSEALQHLISLQGAELLHIIGGEGFVDLQMQRPKIFRNEDGRRALEWPDTRLYGTVHRPGQAPSESVVDAEMITRLDGSPVLDLYFMPGVEPSRDWENFADEVVELAEVWAVDLVVLLGSMYSDAPHSRPIIANLYSESEAAQERYGASKSNYEGPAGITSAIDIALEAAGIEAVSLWVQVPHYVHSAPSPKATLAILDKLEELLDIVIPRGELFSQATEWESNINRIAANDDDMTRYIRSLEDARDEALAAETTGDALAAEFEKFLERDRDIIPHMRADHEIIENREADAGQENAEHEGSESEGVGNDEPSENEGSEGDDPPKDAPPKDSPPTS